MEQMVKDLYKAAVEGSVTSLLDLVKKDELILERCTIVTSYAETPLHVAAMLGHVGFCSELVSRNPRLTREVDYRKSTSLHIASAKGHVAIVIVLAAACPETCLLCDEDGLNPIQIAAMKGRVDVLKELVKANPDGVGARVRTCQGGTALHLCVQYYQIEALKFLVEVKKDDELLNAKDDNGNSILHLSVGDKQVEIVEYLVSRPSIDVDALNSNGLTASNILALQTKRDFKYLEIAHILQLMSSHQPPPLGAIKRASSSISGGSLGERSEKKQAIWVEKQQNSVMIVASVIATMAFQAGVSPPDAISKGDEYANQIFMASNTIGFLSSLSVILLLISGLPLRHKVFMWAWMVIMWISITATVCTYRMAMAVTPNLVTESFAFNTAIRTWFYSLASLFILNTIRFLVRVLHDWSFGSRLFMWVFIILVCVTAGVLHYPSVPAANLYGDYYFSGVVSGWAVSISFLVVLYSIQLTFVFIKKLKAWFKGFKSQLCSGDYSSNNVV